MLPTNRRPKPIAYTLVELMVVIAIIGATLTFAIPIYTTNLYKVNVSQMVNKLGTFSIQMVDTYTANATWPATINNATAPATVADSFFSNAVDFRYNFSGTKAWWGYKLSTKYGSGWIFMLLISNADGTFATHCGALSTSCTFGSCNSANYFPTACSEKNLSTTFTLTDS